ncbi:MFS transporter [Hephaestia sp. GCM10023244]|uniref:MFS transporter n=1 Tax=unclassified Hephaestia TaxID=2631281 RepID=UPI0020776BA4|nr:MFS transporter [Hephaestia sp. MAHUQ-44]MCM8732287.1 MFS transporter [Hephaestia sp. MAHUQ-44]
MSTPPTPDALIKQSPMSWYQYAIVAICVLTYAADGLDVVTLSYAAPVMIEQWGISPETFGLTYSATPVGIALGSIFLSPLADRVGRRPFVLWLLGALVGLLFLTSIVSHIAELVILRLLTGVCLGALVVCLNVTVSEFSNAQRSNLLIGILHTGYSIGGMLCGALAALLIEPFGWQSIFTAATVLNTISFVLAFFLLAESPAFLAARAQERPEALARLNALLRRMNMPAYETLPPAPSAREKKRGGLAAIPRAFWIGTLLLCVAGFVFTVSGGFRASWRPQILAYAGLNMTWNGIAGVTTYGAGVLAHLFVGAIARRGSEVKVAVIFLVMMGVTFVMLGAAPNGMTWALIGASTLSGFFNVGAYTALILVTLNYYDATMRNAGLGIMMGCSRVGGIIGPLLGGYVIGAGASRFWVMLLFGAILVIPVTTLLLARAQRPRTLPADA